MSVHDPSSSKKLFYLEESNSLHDGSWAKTLYFGVENYNNIHFVGGEKKKKRKSSSVENCVWYLKGHFTKQGTIGNTHSII